MQVDAPPLPTHQATTTPMMLSHSSPSSSSSAAVLAAKGERLRSLLFGAEHAERSGDLAGAQVSGKKERRERLSSSSDCVFFSFLSRLVSAFFRSRLKKKSSTSPPPSPSGSNCSPSSRPRAASP